MKSITPLIGSILSSQNADLESKLIEYKRQLGIVEKSLAILTQVSKQSYYDTLRIFNKADFSVQHEENVTLEDLRVYVLKMKNAIEFAPMVDFFLHKVILLELAKITMNYNGDTAPIDTFRRSQLMQNFLKQSILDHPPLKNKISKLAETLCPAVYTRAIISTNINADLQNQHFQGEGRDAQIQLCKHLLSYMVHQLFQDLSLNEQTRSLKQITFLKCGFFSQGFSLNLQCLEILQEFLNHKSKHIPNEDQKEAASIEILELLKLYVVGLHQSKQRVYQKFLQQCMDAISLLFDYEGRQMVYGGFVEYIEKGTLQLKLQNISFRGKDHVIVLFTDFLQLNIASSKFNWTLDFVRDISSNFINLLKGSMDTYQPTPILCISVFRSFFSFLYHLMTLALSSPIFSMRNQYIVEFHSLLDCFSDTTLYKTWFFNHSFKNPSQSNPMHEERVFSQALNSLLLTIIRVHQTLPRIYEKNDNVVDNYYRNVSLVLQKVIPPINSFIIENTTTNNMLPLSLVQCAPTVETLIEILRNCIINKAKVEKGIYPFIDILSKEIYSLLSICLKISLKQGDKEIFGTGVMSAFGQIEDEEFQGDICSILTLERTDITDQMASEYIRKLIQDHVDTFSDLIPFLHSHKPLSTLFDTLYSINSPERTFFMLSLLDVKPVLQKKSPIQGAQIQIAIQQLSEAFFLVSEGRGNEKCTQEMLAAQFSSLYVKGAPLFLERAKGLLITGQEDGDKQESYHQAIEIVAKLEVLFELKQSGMQSLKVETLLIKLLCKYLLRLQQSDILLSIQLTCDESAIDTKVLAMTSRKETLLETLNNDSFFLTPAHLFKNNQDANLATLRNRLREGLVTINKVQGLYKAISSGTAFGIMSEVKIIAAEYLRGRILREVLDMNEEEFERGRWFGGNQSGQEELSKLKIWIQGNFKEGLEIMITIKNIITELCQSTHFKLGFDLTSTLHLFLTSFPQDFPNQQSLIIHNLLDSALYLHKFQNQVPAVQQEQAKKHYAWLKSEIDTYFATLQPPSNSYDQSYLSLCLKYSRLLIKQGHIDEAFTHLSFLQTHLFKKPSESNPIKSFLLNQHFTLLEALRLSAKCLSRMEGREHQAWFEFKKMNELLRMLEGQLYSKDEVVAESEAFGRKYQEIVKCNYGKVMETIRKNQSRTIFEDVNAEWCFSGQLLSARQAIQLMLSCKKSFRTFKELHLGYYNDNSLFSKPSLFELSQYFKQGNQGQVLVLGLTEVIQTDLSLKSIQLACSDGTPLIKDQKEAIERVKFEIQDAIRQRKMISIDGEECQICEGQHDVAQRESVLENRQIENMNSILQGQLPVKDCQLSTFLVALLRGCIDPSRIRQSIIDFNQVILDSSKITGCTSYSSHMLMEISQILVEGTSSFKFGHYPYLLKQVLSKSLPNDHPLLPKVLLSLVWPNFDIKCNLQAFTQQQNNIHRFANPNLEQPKRSSTSLERAVNKSFTNEAKDDTDIPINIDEEHKSMVEQVRYLRKEEDTKWERCNLLTAQVIIEPVDSLQINEMKAKVLAIVPTLTEDKSVNTLSLIVRNEGKELIYQCQPGAAKFFQKMDLLLEEKDLYYNKHQFANKQSKVKRNSDVDQLRKELQAQLQVEMINKVQN
ncbi:hypothetical protein FGO68_gene3621 [Halteria grandinella]|uniref:Uncharacterized protein n=1 Tax=Halteria grandinella TaxID=5974 RepID=A0A8J8T9Z8_HALGN|nr:hypothetical protein FGO68_gene3621 [Halteria grandinella]